MSVSTMADQVEALLAGPRPLPIVQAGRPVLRQVATPYDGQLSDLLLAELIEAMRDTMHAAPGVGLAAPQVGLGLALAVLEDDWGDEPDPDDPREHATVPFRVIINPHYEPVGTERVAFYEGCLSVKGYAAVTPRWRSVRLTGHDETGAALDEVLTGWPARIVQHETDHLRGRLYLDGAELRSLLSPEEAARYAVDPTPARAAAELGFALP
ncbi:peptide deformylase [Actinotalea sp. M2MS4P-6]|uniref:peptide deformylase n=1 Tax=Actinotalea sp. M2MS4P-6 TaxID=2983762 RepID=UPI0021E45739|nr:peptide deformylase [Actinotalea sp. M2MS4P-6]MCV2395529.1 peptide deformylase [Actinotalea sp. M2MS4P-6]